jgi:hypothetical protein
LSYELVRLGPKYLATGEIAEKFRYIHFQNKSMFEFFAILADALSSDSTHIVHGNGSGQTP